MASANDENADAESGAFHPFRNTKRSEADDSDDVDGAFRDAIEIDPRETRDAARASKARLALERIWKKGFSLSSSNKELLLGFPLEIVRW